MKKAFIILASVSAACVIALGILTGCLFKSIADLKESNTELASSLDAATERVAALETSDTTKTQQIADLESDNTTNKQKLASLESQLSASLKRISELENANKKMDDEIYLLQEQCESLQNQINQINALISTGSV